MGIISIMSCDINDGGECSCGEHEPMVKHPVDPQEIGLEDQGVPITTAHPDTPEDRARCSKCEVNSVED